MVEVSSSHVVLSKTLYYTIATRVYLTALNPCYRGAEIVSVFVTLKKTQLFVSSLTHNNFDKLQSKNGKMCGSAPFLWKLNTISGEIFLL